MRSADNGVRRMVGFVLVLIGLVPIVVMPVATGVPGDGGQLADAPTLALAAVGSDDAFALYGLRGIQTLTIPVPDGLTPSSLNVLVELPVGVRGGNMLVTQDDRSISRTALPTGFQAPLTMPLVGAEVVDNSVTLQLRSYLDPLDGYCLYDPIVPLRLSNASVSFAGTEVAPRVVADFLPPVLRALTLFVPASPSQAESDAAIRMTTAVVAHYGKQPVRVRVATLEGDVIPPAPAGPFERQVVIREGPDIGVSLRGHLPTEVTNAPIDRTSPGRLVAGQPVAAPPGWATVKRQDYRDMKRLYGDGAVLVRQWMAPLAGDPRFDKFSRPRTVVVDSLVSQRPYTFGVYPGRVLYGLTGARFSAPRQIDLGMGVTGRLVSVIDDDLLVTWNSVQFAWGDNDIAQRFTIFAVDNHDPGAPFPEPSAELTSAVRTLITLLFRGNAVLEAKDSSFKDADLLAEFGHALVAAQFEPSEVR